MSSLAKNDNAEHCKSILSTMLRQEVHYNKSPYLATTKKRGGAAPDVACRAKVCRVSNALHVDRLSPYYDAHTNIFLFSIYSYQYSGCLVPSNQQVYKTKPPSSP